MASNVPLIPVSGSSLVKGYFYDAAAEELTLALASGGRYTYTGVPLSTFLWFIGSPSLGKAFQHIKNNFSFV